MAYQDVEDLVFRGEPSHVWLETVSEEDIIEYLGIKKPFEYHPDVIPLICRFPFTDEEHVIFVCQRFLKLLVQFDKYLYRYKDRIDVLLFMAGFLEASGFTPAVSQLVFHRNLLLKQGFSSQSGEVLSLHHAIQGLFGLKFRQPWSR